MARPVHAGRGRLALCALGTIPITLTALEVRHRGDKPWEAFQYRDIGFRSPFTPTRFEVRFEGRDERCKLVVKGRSLQGIYAVIVQHRLEWIEAAGRDFADDGHPIVTAVEVVTEKVKP